MDECPSVLASLHFGVVDPQIMEKQTLFGNGDSPCVGTFESPRPFPYGNRRTYGNGDPPNGKHFHIYGDFYLNPPNGHELYSETGR